MALYLGSDAAGDWLGFPTGSLMSRPGFEFTSTNDQVGLVPRRAPRSAGPGWRPSTGPAASCGPTST